MIGNSQFILSCQDKLVLQPRKEALDLAKFTLIIFLSPVLQQMKRCWPKKNITTKTDTLKTVNPNLVRAIVTACLNAIAMLWILSMIQEKLQKNPLEERLQQ